MVKRIIIFTLLFVIIGSLYAHIALSDFTLLTEMMDSVLNKISPGIHEDIALFLPLILIDIIVCVICSKGLGIIRQENVLRCSFKCGLYLLLAIVVSVISFLVWTTVIVVITMCSF